MSEPTQTRPLYRFAVIPQVQDRLADLAEIAEPEEWNYANTPTDHELPILYNYLHYTFERLEYEDKVGISMDEEFACFNTGLATVHQEPIFAFFDKNRFPEDSRRWHFQRFCRRGERELNHFQKLPEMAHYFDDPVSLVFDTRLELRVNVEHIINDNKPRFPEPYRTMDNYALQNFLKGTIESGKERVRRNYKAAVPQFYRGNIQLLLPLCISQPTKADLALVVERGEGFYRASTCLTLDMAYNNARQLARPDRDWLQP
jgi:Domain of unknown function (DUF3825)